MGALGSKFEENETLNALFNRTKDIDSSVTHHLNAPSAVLKGFLEKPEKRGKKKNALFCAVPY